MWRALGSLPAPVIFGSFIDRSCILWRESCGEKGDCLAYKSGNVVFVIISASLVLQGMSVANNICRVFVQKEVKAAFQLSVFHTYVHARKCLNSSK